MFDAIFGKPSAGVNTAADGESDFQEHVLDVSTRRTQQEVAKLVRRFQKVLDSSMDLQTRSKYFWPTVEFLDRVLFALAQDIPKAVNPLWPDDQTEIFPDENHRRPAHEATVASTIDAEISELGGKSPASSADLSSTTQLGRRKKKRQTTTLPRCVEWLGLVNEDNGYAAIKLVMPATYEKWVTWTNRVIVFLFGIIPGYQGPEDFNELLQPPSGGPFRMRCHNPRCVRLSHIQYLPDSLRQELEAHLSSQTPPFLAVPGGATTAEFQRGLPNKARFSSSLDHHPLTRASQGTPMDEGESWMTKRHQTIMSGGNSTGKKKATRWEHNDSGSSSASESDEIKGESSLMPSHNRDNNYRLDPRSSVAAARQREETTSVWSPGFLQS